jgi:hypothetical protein
MAKAKTRRIIAGGGWAMLTLLTGFGALRITGWASNNKERLDVAIAISAVLMLAALVFWLSTKDDAQEEVVIPLSNALTAGGDANGNKQISVGGDLHLHEAPTFVPAPQLGRRSPQRRPNLIGLEPKLVREDEDFLRGQHRWKPFAVFPIENRIGRTISARDVCASIRFNGSPENYVKKAYWRGRSGNVNEIPIGEIQFVVIGQKIDDRWYYFDNPTAYPSTWGSSSSTRPSEIGSLILPSEGITALLAVFYPDNGNKILTVNLHIGNDGKITRIR